MDCLFNFHAIIERKIASGIQKKIKYFTKIHIWHIGISFSEKSWRIVFLRALISSIKS